MGEKERTAVRKQGATLSGTNQKKNAYDCTLRRHWGEESRNIKMN